MRVYLSLECIDSKSVEVSIKTLHELKPPYMRYRLALTLSVSTTNDLLSQRLSVRGCWVDRRGTSKVIQTGG